MLGFHDGVIQADGEEHGSGWLALLFERRSALPVTGRLYPPSQVAILSKWPDHAGWVYYGGDMSLSSPIYYEIIDFIAAGTTPQSVANFLPSPEAQQRLAALMDREKAGTLSPEEKAEIDHFMELEHILRMAKARARQIVSRGK